MIAAIAGLNGEIEHASALIHTLHFGNHYHNAVGAKSYLSFCNTRGPANAPLMIPLALGASIGGRPHHKIGDRYQDLKELGHDVENPASV